MRLALRLLLAIADDPLMRPSYRIAARRHLRRLSDGEVVLVLDGAGLLAA